MSEIKYDDKSHTYWLNGAKAPSVTQILAWKFSKKYEGIDEATLKAAAEKGTELHNAIECYEKYGLERTDLQEFRDYLFIKNAFNVEVLDNEQMVAYSCLHNEGEERYNIQYCGRTDLIATVDGKKALIDIKRTAVADKDYLFYQLNLYRIAYMQTFERPIEKLGCIHLREGKRKYIDIPINVIETLKLLDEYWQANMKGGYK